MVGHDSGKPEGGTRWVVRGSRAAHVVFYTDYCIFGSRDPDCLQHSMSVLVSPFLWYGIAANVSNSCLMTCQTGAFRLGISVDTGDINCMGLGDSYHMRLRQRIPCLECGVELSAGSTLTQRCCMNRTEPTIDWNRLPISQVEHHLQVYDVSFPWSTNWCPCPFLVAQVSSRTWNGLCLRFNSQNWGYSIMILEDHPNYPPQVRELQETSHSGESEQLKLCPRELQAGRGTTTPTRDPTTLL